MVEMTEETQSCTNRRVRTDRRSRDQQIERALATHFENFPLVALTQMEVEGLTLPARIAQDFAKAKEEKRRLSSVYWIKLRKMYGGGMENEGLTVTDKSLTICTQLWEALELATNTNTTLKSKSGLLKYFGSCNAVNQKEYVGVVRHMLECRPTTSTASVTFFLEYMKWVQRLTLSERFPEETKKVSSHMDQV